jgi:initiation factor 1A
MPRKSKFENKTGFQYADSSIGQLYSTVEKPLGNCHFTVKTINEESKCSSLSGNMKKGSRVRPGDFVLIEPLTESDVGKYQIIYRYTSKEKKILEKEGYLKTVKDQKDAPEKESFYFEGEQEKFEEDALELDSKFIDNI